MKGTPISSVQFESPPVPSVSLRARKLLSSAKVRARGSNEYKLAPSPNDSALKARTQRNSPDGDSFCELTRTQKIDEYGKKGTTDPRIPSTICRGYGVVPEGVSGKELTPLTFDTDAALRETPPIFTTCSSGGRPNAFGYRFCPAIQNVDPYQTFIISSGHEGGIVGRNNAINIMKAVSDVTDGAEPEGEYPSYVITRAREEEEVGARPRVEPPDVTDDVPVVVNSSDGYAVANGSNFDRCLVEGTAVQEGAVLSFADRKEQAFSRLQDELRRAHQELKLKDEEVSRLTRIREDVERELEDLTASLFQEAHKMVREANERQATAEKALTESQMKVEVLTAEVAALKTLVLTSTPSRPNPHLHPQIGKDDSAAGVTLFSRKHRRSPSHFNLKYGRENSPPGSPVRDQRSSLSESSSCSVDGRDSAEMDPNLHKDFLGWKEKAKLDKTDPFIDRIYREDINLCLDFSNKELGEEVRKAIEARDIYVEAVTDKTKTIFPRKCALLEVTRQCHYRMKLGDQDIWYSISQMCRNRIIAVCDFLNYLRYIELGLVKSTDHDMYWEIIRLRKEMVLARLGLSLSSS